MKCAVKQKTCLIHHHYAEKKSPPPPTFRKKKVKTKEDSENKTTTHAHFARVFFEKKNTTTFVIALGLTRVNSWGSIECYTTESNLIRDWNILCWSHHLLMQQKKEEKTLCCCCCLARQIVVSGKKHSCLTSAFLTHADVKGQQEPSHNGGRVEPEQRNKKMERYLIQYFFCSFNFNSKIFLFFLWISTKKENVQFYRIFVDKVKQLLCVDLASSNFDPILLEGHTHTRTITTDIGVMFFSFFSFF